MSFSDPCQTFLATLEWLSLIETLLPLALLVILAVALYGLDLLVITTSVYATLIRCFPSGGLPQAADAVPARCLNSRCPAWSPSTPDSRTCI